jgi:hypothetical protein
VPGFTPEPPVDVVLLLLLVLAAQPPTNNNAHIANPIASRLLFSRVAHKLSMAIISNHVAGVTAGRHPSNRTGLQRHPIGAAPCAIVVIVSVAVAAVVPLGVTGFGEIEQLALCGAPMQLKLTG